MTTHHTSAEIGTVRGSTFHGGKHRRQTKASSSASCPAAGKACSRCGSTNHFANNAKCPAKAAVCRQCNKNGHNAKLCKGKTASQDVRKGSTTVSESADTVVALQIDDVTLYNKLMCYVSLEASDGPTVTADLILHTGSGVSILPEQICRSHFSHRTLSKQETRLTTYTQKPTQVLGCMKLKVTYETNSVYTQPCGASGNTHIGYGPFQCAAATDFRWKSDCD